MWCNDISNRIWFVEQTSTLEGGKNKVGEIGSGLGGIW